MVGSGAGGARISLKVLLFDECAAWQKLWRPNISQARDVDEFRPPPLPHSGEDARVPAVETTALLRVQILSHTRGHLLDIERLAEDGPDGVGAALVDDVVGERGGGE